MAEDLDHVAGWDAGLVICGPGVGPGGRTPRRRRPGTRRARRRIHAERHDGEGSRSSPPLWKLA